MKRSSKGIPFSHLTLKNLLDHINTCRKSCTGYNCDKRIIILNKLKLLKFKFIIEIKMKLIKLIFALFTLLSYIKQPEAKPQRHLV